MDSLVLGGTATLAVALGSYYAAFERSEVPKEVLSDAKIKYFPLIAGITLTTIRVLFYIFGPSVVNYGFMFYLGLTGTNCIWYLLRTFLSMKSRKLFMYPKSHSILTEFVLPSKPIPFFLHDIPLYIIAILVNVYYFTTKNQVTNNIIAFSIAFYSIMAIRIGKFKNAWPLVWSLILYDVFFVYLTTIMTDVATNLEGPVKLIFRTRSGGLSILGLGDLVLPGLFVSVCSRFDAFMYRITQRKSPYWAIAICGYASGLLTTDLVCFLMQSGQPALLFIVPFVTIPVLITTIIRKEYYAFASFSG